MNARIVVLPGDGVGPEVTREAVRALSAVASIGGHQFDLVTLPIGGAAIDVSGMPLPAETAVACVEADAVLLGAVGDPKHDAGRIRPEHGLLELRRVMGVYANLRPIVAHAAGTRVSPLQPERLAGVDLLFVRELTGGIYFGEKTREVLPGGGETARDVCTYTTGEIERVTRRAAHLARSRRRRLTSIDKANVLETSRLWRSVVSRVLTEEFPDIALEHLLVDAAAMHLLLRPADFDVLVTENMFGDILTDEAAVLAGSIGLLPSASLGDGGRGLYEPVHGSAPQLAGRDAANPVGAILSAALLLRHSLGLEEEAAAVEAATLAVLDSGILTADLAPAGSEPAGTAAVGRAIATCIERSTSQGARAPEATHA
jgi:3-isopropylmalate dehydrogenase